MKSLDEFRKRVTGHRERLRRRFLEYGLSAFTDEDILEMLLAFGTPRKDTRGLARELLRRFGSLPEVLETPLEKLTEVPGIGTKNVLPLKFVHEVARRYLRRRIENREYIRSAREVYEYLAHELADRPQEIFKVLFLDSRGRILAVEELFRGTLNESAVYPREIFSRALNFKAASLVLVHNHPSGDPSPSSEDVSLTRRLILAAQVLGLQILDHVIIGREGYFSFAEEGLIHTIKQELARVKL
ncbi:RadC family protein [Thermosulfurimonas dismutans]|uniref:DNA repair protein RadC n=1 Tax=Thermosulfurimonas dismutans TaxID=999894 RepID=A0A179D5J2_9BACT|nr:DNA repair protein RadC [Thermosulfurimonas dismutans]OAQ21370.1 DNA repair protein RadC [Thermosulfurimonas dismutans]